MAPEEEEELTFEPEKDLAYGLKELLKAMPGYEKGHNYYYGNEGEKYLSPVLKRMLTGSDNDFQVNLAPRVVDAVTDRLAISALNVTIDNGTVTHSLNMSGDSSNATVDGSGSAVSRALNINVWEDNELDQETPEIHLKAGYLGDSYLFVWGNPDDENAVDIFLNSPTVCRVFYEEENPRKKRFAIKRWVTNEGKIRVNLYYPDWVIKFVTVTSKPDRFGDRSRGLRWNARGEKESEFVRFVDEDTDDEGVMVNPYGRVPFYHFRTARPYGVPLHKNAYGPQDAITKLVRSQMTVTDFAAFPQRWALGETGVGTDGDEDWLSDESPAPSDLQSDFISGPGRVWKLTGTRMVGQFPEANVDQILKPLDKFIELMAASTGTPMTYLNKISGTASTPLSGAAQREIEASHLKRVDNVKRSFSATWRDALSDALEILGFEGATVTVDWETTYFRDEEQTWQAAILQNQAGVPKRQVLMEQNYTAAQCDEWGYTVEEPNGPEPDFGNMDPFQAAQKAPVRPELAANQGKLPATLRAENAAKKAEQSAQTPEQ